MLVGVIIGRGSPSAVPDGLDGGREVLLAPTMRGHLPLVAARHAARPDSDIDLVLLTGEIGRYAENG